MAKEFDNQETETNLTALEDITVDTMGLVERGAVGETFFLLKNNGGIMAEEIEGLEINEDVIKEEVSPGFLEKLGRQRLLGWLSKMDDEQSESDQPIEEDPPVETEKAKDETKKALSGGAKRGVMALIREYGGELPPNVVGMLRGLLGGGSDDDKEKTQKDDEVKTMAEEKEKEVKKEVVEETPTKEVAKADEVITPPVTDPALLARLEKAEKANEAILARLEKSESDLEKARTLAQQEREARQRITYIEKAREFGLLPVQADELGGFLHRLAKADEVANIEKAEDAEDRQTDFEYVIGVLKAANEQLKQAGFFAEAGTTKEPGDMDLIDKAAAMVEKGDYETLKEALLNVSPDEAEKYLGQFKDKN